MDTSRRESAWTQELLLEQTEWLRRLARRLVDDVHLADDLAQETLVAALERPPQLRPDEGDEGGETRLRGWLRRVMGNLRTDRMRSGAARRRREAAGARPERLPGTDELLGRVETGHRVTALLMELEEPFRTTLLLRFYEQLPPRKIAARQGVSVATVKSRVTRGLSKLRERMDRDFGGGRREWLAALAPFARDVELVGATTLGGAALNTKLITAAVTVAAGTGAWLLLGGEPAGLGPYTDTLEPVALEASPDGTPDRRGASTRPSGTPEPQTPPVDPRRSAVEALRGEATDSEPEPAPRSVRGRVLDQAGEVLAGVRVRLVVEGSEAAGPASLATTNAAGAFELTTTAPRGTIEPADPAWVAVRAGSWASRSRLEPVLVLAPAIQVGGTVADAWGRPLQDARIALALPDGFASRFDRALDATFDRSWTATADADGRFELTDVPAIAGARLSAVHPGYEPSWRELPGFDDTGLWIELGSRALQEEDALTGVVLRADGTPASDALVSLGAVSVPTDRSGSFALALDRVGQAGTLWAVEAGSLPATLVASGAGSDRDAWPATIELRLGGAPLSIRGRVVDERGEPRPGGRVWLADPTPFAQVGSVPVRLESLMAGGAVPTLAIDSLAEEGDYASARPIYEPNALVWWVETDAEGRFELPGLADRDYTLNVLDRELHWGEVVGPLSPGLPGSAEAEITVSSDRSYARLTGLVSTEQGDPVPGVAVTPWVPAFEANEPTPKGTTSVMRFFLGEPAVTDEQGRFVLAQVPRRGVQFHLISDGIVPSYASVDEVTDPERFDLTVLARVHLEIDLSSPGSAAFGAPRVDAVRARDRDGQVVQILELRADGYSNLERLALADGRSGVVAITSNAVELELLSGDEVVERIPVSPRPGTPLRIVR